jgi:hypothetical protein
MRSERGIRKSAHVVHVPEGGVGRQRRQADLVVAQAPGAAQAGQPPPAARRLLLYTCMHHLSCLCCKQYPSDSLLHANAMRLYCIWW